MTDSRRSPLRAALVLEAIALAAVVTAWAIIAVAWSALPERVPQHSGAGGLPDAYGPKVVIAVPAGVALATYLLFTLVQRIPARFYFMPARVTEQNAEAQQRLAHALLHTLKAGLSVLLAVGTWLTVQVALGHRARLGGWYLPATLLLTFAPLAWFGAKAYRARTA